MIVTVGQAAAQDGTKIAFSSVRGVNQDIWVMNADGTSPTNLTNDPASDSTPSFSPDRKFIAFTSFRNGNSDIYVMNADGSGQTRLTDDPATDVTPSFSPDGTKIAFASFRHGNSDIWVMDVDLKAQPPTASEPTKLTNGVTPAFSPDGTIAFSSFRDANRDIYVMDVADPLHPKRLTFDEADDRFPAFSPDGTKIAFARGVTLGNRDIWVMDAADGSGQWNLTDDPADDVQPTYSLDGTKIAFASNRPNWEIYVMAADGSNEATNLTNHPTSADFQPAWGPLTGTDTDGDGVPDLYDNCRDNANGHQENSDGDDDGDVCDPDTINPILEGVVGGASELHASTPFYRLAAFTGVGLQFSAEAGLGATRKGQIGLDNTDVITVAPSAASIPYALSGATTIAQNTWQSAVAQGLFTSQTDPSAPPINAHGTTFADGMGMGYEVTLSAIPPGDFSILHILTLPSGWTLDATEVGGLGVSGVGRLTIKDDAGNARIRISAVEFMSFGHDTTLEDSPDFTPIDGVCTGLQSMEYDDGGYNCALDPPLVQSSYTLGNLMGDLSFGTTTVYPIEGPGPPQYYLTVTAPADAIDDNRMTSELAMLGFRISSLQPVDLDAVPVVHGRHFLNFSEEAFVTGNNVTLEMHNETRPEGAPPEWRPTFDGEPTLYHLLPNCELYGVDVCMSEEYQAAEQQQTGVLFAGSKVVLTGTSNINFVTPGGVGVGLTAGPRVAASHPCIGTDPLDVEAATGRCAEGYNLRGSLQADSLAIVGSMSGLVVAESDATIEAPPLPPEGFMNALVASESNGTLVGLKFIQALDPNVTDPTLLQAVVGVGCSGEAGFRFGRNPADGQVTANVPVDASACTPDAVGAGTCLPTPLNTSPSTGICNFKADRVELVGMGSITNPLGQDLLVPSGDGMAFHMRSGRAQIGGRSYDAATDTCQPSGIFEPSRIVGFEVMASLSGGANVDPATGAPLSGNDPMAVDPIVYCLDNIVGDELELGLAIHGNVDARLSHFVIKETQMGAIHVANGAANEQDLASTTAAGHPCESTDEVTCDTPVSVGSCPSCGKYGKNFMTTAASGKSSPTKVKVSQSSLCLDDVGNVVAGQNPAIPEPELDEDLKVISDFMIGYRDAGIFKSCVLLAAGPDAMPNPNSPPPFAVEISDSDVGCNDTITCIGVDQKEIGGGVDDAFDFGDTFFTADGMEPKGGSATAYTKADGDNTTLDDTTQAGAAQDSSEGGTITPEDVPSICPDPSDCSIDSLCPCEGPADGGKWKNHGSYARCVARASKDFLDAGVISWSERQAIIIAAGQSSCGAKK